MDHVLAGIIKQRTVVLVTHNKTSLSFCNRIYFMEHGRLHELAKESLLDGGLDAVVLDDAEASDNYVDDHRNRLNFNAERDDSSEDLEEEKGTEVDAQLDGAAAVMVAETAQDHITITEPVSENVELFRSASVELNQEKILHSSSDGKKLSGSGRKSGAKSDSNVNKGGQLTVKEDRVEGQVTWATYAQYARDGGG